MPAAEVAAAADYVRTTGDSILFFSNSLPLTKEHALALCAQVFPSCESSVDWAAALGLLPETDDILLKVHGGFDDREVSVYGFMDSNLIKRLTP